MMGHPTETDFNTDTNDLLLINHLVTARNHANLIVIPPVLMLIYGLKLFTGCLIVRSEREHGFPDSVVDSKAWKTSCFEMISPLQRVFRAFSWGTHSPVECRCSRVSPGLIDYSAESLH